MLKFFKIYFVYLVISFSPILQTYPQNILTDNNFLSQNFILSLNGGVSYGYSDYKNSSFGPAFRGSLEYYPILIRNARLGFKAYVGGLKLNFDDARNSISTNDGPRDIPREVVTNIYQFGAGLSFGYAFGEHIIPSITVGGSYLSFSPNYSDGSSLPFNAQEKYNKGIVSFTIEGDLKIKLSEKLSINALISYYPTSTDYLEDVSAATNNDSYLTGMLGLSYALSGNSDSDGDGISDGYDQCPETPIGINVDEFGCPIDSDLDGVPDYLDKCINTPVGAPVDSIGCPLDSDKDGVPDYLDKCPSTPANIAIDSIGCPIDTDKDGVADYLDKCLNTPYGVEVDSIGCPVDSDKDGVPDFRDSCPDTPLNTKVDSTGCPQGQADIIYQFNLRGDDTFDNNTANLKESAKLILNEISFYIQNQPGSKWRIEGHMDSQGSVSTIKKLSYDRAKAVLDFLVSKGVAKEQFEIYGLGDSFPAGNNNTAEGRAANRRIMIIRED